MSSDKGLCGGIHSSVSKATRRVIADPENPVDADSPVMVIGDKSKAQLARALGKNLALAFNQIGRDIPTFADAAGVADLIVKSGVEYDSIALVYNRFVSAISYEAGIVEVANENTFKESRKPVLLCMVCSVLIYTLCSWFPCIRDGGRCHQGPCRVLTSKRHLRCPCRSTRVRTECSVRTIASRRDSTQHLIPDSRNAMDNASKNAKDMIGALTMQYNRGRQAAITNELVDIITGALQRSVFLWWRINMA